MLCDKVYNQKSKKGDNLYYSKFVGSGLTDTFIIIVVIVHDRFVLTETVRQDVCE